MSTQPRFKDVSLTFRANPVTGDVVTLLDDDAVKASVKNLVLTMNYEIPFHPEIGCAVMTSLFDNFSPATAINIRRSIMDVLQNFEPRVTVLGVDVQVDPDANGYNAMIIFRIINRPEPVTITLFLQKER
jgi:phage baseplate assembly protein W